jgi:hypothetical protein
MFSASSFAAGLSENLRKKEKEKKSPFSSYMADPLSIVQNYDGRTKIIVSIDVST